MPKKHFSFIKSFVIIFILAGIVSYCMMVLLLPTIVTLFLCIVYISTISFFAGYTLEDINEFILDGVRKSAFVVVMLLAIGCLIGGWIASGIIPTIIYYGLDIIDPNYFLVVGLISCGERQGNTHSLGNSNHCYSNSSDTCISTASEI
jgi:NhaC family Na+:H+ antiporter